MVVPRLRANAARPVWLPPYRLQYTPTPFSLAPRHHHDSALPDWVADARSTELLPGPLPPRAYGSLSGSYHMAFSLVGSRRQLPATFHSQRLTRPVYAP